MCTEALVQAGANLETVDRAGYARAPFIHGAAWQRSKSVDFDRVSFIFVYRATAYLGACYGGSQSCQKLLLLAGSKKDAVDKFGNDATAYLSHMLSREEKANSLGDFDGAVRARVSFAKNPIPSPSSPHLLPIDFTPPH